MFLDRTRGSFLTEGHADPVFPPKKSIAHYVQEYRSTHD